MTIENPKFKAGDRIVPMDRNLRALHGHGRILAVESRRLQLGEVSVYKVYWHPTKAERIAMELVGTPVISSHPIRVIDGFYEKEQNA